MPVGKKKARAKAKLNVMERTCIWMEPELRKALDTAAIKTGVSRAFLIRQALRREVGLQTITAQEVLSETVFG